MRFVNRVDAGRQLAVHLAAYRDADTLVLGLPRGGVVVAAQVAAALGAPLDVVVARKLGLPGHPEFAMGAIAGDVSVLNDSLITMLGVTAGAVRRVVDAERAEMARRERQYRKDAPPPPVAGKTVVLVDDGIATGATVLAAVRWLQRQHPRAVVVAAPVCAPDAEAMLAREADRVVTLAAPAAFRSVGEWYDEFDPTSDAEVLEALADAQAAAAGERP